MTNRGWLTPNSGATTTVCRPILIPIDDQLFFMAAINGALNELTKEYNWEQFGDMTPAEAAAAMLDMYLAYVDTECTAGCVCTIPPVYDIDVGIELKVIRRNAAGFTEELVGDEWQAPTGDYEVPDPDARTESTSDQRKCAAAANAINVLEQVYEEATDAYQAFATPAAVADAILDVIILVMGAFGQVTAASYISFGQNVFETFVDVFSLVTGDFWTNDYTNELECIFIANATDTAGVITFDYQAIEQDLIDLEYAAGVDVDRQIVLAQTRYILSLIAAGGINFAGGLTIVASPNCDQCWPWTVTWNFTTGANGATGVAYSGCTSTRNASGWNACSNGSVWSMNVTKDPTPVGASSHVTKVTVEWQPFGSGVNERATSFLRVFHSAGSFDVPVDNNPASSAIQTSVVAGIDVHTITRFEIVWNGTGVGGLSYRKLTIEGYGPILS